MVNIDNVEDRLLTDRKEMLKGLVALSLFLGVVLFILCIPYWLTLRFLPYDVGIDGVVLTPIFSNIYIRHIMAFFSSASTVFVISFIMVHTTPDYGLRQ